jgi:hypothetical protein
MTRRIRPRTATTTPARAKAINIRQRIRRDTVQSVLPQREKKEINRELSVTAQASSDNPEDTDGQADREKEMLHNG